MMLPVWPDSSTLPSAGMPSASGGEAIRSDSGTDHSQQQQCLGTAIVSQDGRTNVTVLDMQVLPEGAWQQLHKEWNSATEPTPGGWDPSGTVHGGAAGVDGEYPEVTYDPCDAAAGTDAWPHWRKRVCGGFGWRQLVQPGAWDLGRSNGVHCEPVG